MDNDEAHTVTGTCTALDTDRKRTMCGPAATPGNAQLSSPEVAAEEQHPGDGRQRGEGRGVAAVGVVLDGVAVGTRRHGPDASRVEPGGAPRRDVAVVAVEAQAGDEYGQCGAVGCTRAVVGGSHD